ncbi:EamA family transporter [candidate division KSB1 bacterium]|nr:EamA family transporter [candidate division KSB1 bacterium]
MKKAKHTTSGRWKLGFALAFSAAVLWGLLPIALKGLLNEMDPVTITWYRFLLAALVLAAFVFRKNGVLDFGKFRGTVLILLLVAGLSLYGNYILFLFGLNYLTPGVSQIVIQLAPVFMLLGGLIIFGERFSATQWIGLAILLSGMVLFFNERMAELISHFTGYTIGILLIITAAFIWSFYGLAQKQLLKTFPSEIIMLFIYFSGIFVLLPGSKPGQLSQLDATQIGLLIFCGLNTLLAYGSFAEALDHWEASRISAVLATTPIITIIAVKIGAAIFPSLIQPEHLNMWSIIGALMVVGGSMISALYQHRKK